MTRALSLTCLALLLVGVGGSSARADKPTIAVLGLEVVDQSGTPSQADTQVAKDLTEGLRARAKAGTGTYQIAVNADKELIDEKLLKNCDSEAPMCMAAIGSDLGAAMLMYGKIEKLDKQGKYQVSMKLLDVRRKAVDKSSSDLIPISQSSGAELQGWAKKIYAKLTGESSSGMIVVKVSNAERGTILVDGEPKGSITNGTGQVAGLADGKYKLAVESEGFHRWERDVSVIAGQSTSVPVELERSATSGGIGDGDLGHPIKGPEGGAPSTGMWKGMLIGGVVVGLAGGGWWIVNASKISSTQQKLCDEGAYADPTKNWPLQNCSTTPISPDRLKELNNQGNSAHTQTIIGGVVAGVGGAVALVALYQVLTSKGSSSSTEHAATGHRKHRDRFVVTPVLTPNGGGATLQFDW